MPTGELLPHLFTITTQSRRSASEVAFLWLSFSVTLLKPHSLLPVRQYGTLRCPDVPHLMVIKPRTRQTAQLLIALTLYLLSDLDTLSRVKLGITLLNSLYHIVGKLTEEGTRNAIFSCRCRSSTISALADTLHKRYLPE